MILSFKHEFIFFPIPKTGTHSVREALRPLLHHLDWEQCILFEKKHFPIAELAEIEHGHISYHQLQNFIFPSVLEKYLKFCFVRNPLNRFVSFCYFFNRENDRMQKSPIDTMKYTISNTKLKSHVLMQPQFTFLTNSHHEVKVDFVGRYEYLQSDFKKISELLKLPASTLKVKNKTLYKPNMVSFDSELLDMVYDFYHQDYILFEYKKNDEITL